jgi:tetratricopeptide (TPR) repeat protein
VPSLTRPTPGLTETATDLAAADLAAVDLAAADLAAVDLAAAERVLELVGGDPRQALVIAEALLGRPFLEAEARAVAERAAGLAELELGRVGAARLRFERAKDQALAAGLDGRAAGIRLGLAITMLQCEEPDAAMAEVDAALELVTDEATLGKVQSQRATILMRLGRYTDALEQSASALTTCRSAGLVGPVARLLSNRGIVHAYLGDYARAERELQEALGLLREQGVEFGAANVVHNLGFVAARRGDVPTALAHFDEALAEYVRLGLPVHSARIDRCEVMMSARLLPEARASADEAVADLQEAGLAADLAEARLMLAEIGLASGDLPTARAEALEAATALARQGRDGWAALARFVAARASWTDHTPPLSLAAEALKLAGELEVAGWRVHGLEARIAAARAAMAARDEDLAFSALASVQVRGNRYAASSSDERAKAWHAVALARLAAGNRSGALRALRRGLQIAEEHRATFGATELRARAATSSADLAELGLELVLQSGRAGRVLEWSERWRARSLWSPDVLPPPDPVVAERLAQLRHTVAALEQAVQAGEAGGPEAAELARRRRRLETEIRLRSLRATAERRAAPPAVTLRQLQAALGPPTERVLVELVHSGGLLHAVVATERTCVMRELGPVEELERWRAAVRFALGRLIVGRDSPASLVAAAQLLQRAAREADTLIFAPLSDDLPEPAEPGSLRVGLSARLPEIVLVPTGSLHSMPWAVLPSLQGRAVSVTPSAALWLNRATAPPRPGHTVLVVGPGIPRGRREVEAIASLWAGARILDGGAATARAVAAAMRGAGVAHVVAHGRFRADNALFSSLDVADGPLTVYDLEEIGDPPQLIILSACDAGRSEVQPGDELMGTAAALLSLGSRAIVAGVVPVPDATTPEVMASLHRRLAAGCGPAAALALTQIGHGLRELEPAELAGRSDRALAALAASAFVCFGAGGTAAAGPPYGPGPRTRASQVAAKLTK